MEKPYIEIKKVTIIRKYNPNYGDGRICKCGHTYYRHFDSCEDNYPCGCKYCGCYDFEEINQQKNKIIEESEILLVKELIDKIRVFLSDYVPSPGPFFKWSNEYYEATEVLLKEITKIENKLNI